MPKVNPRNKVGVIVHAVLKNILGNHTMKNVSGNINYMKTFIRGNIVNVFNRHITGGGGMNNITNNTPTKAITNTTTNMELGWKQPNPQLAERVVGEVCGIHC